MKLTYLWRLIQTNRVNQQLSLYDTRLSPTRPPLMFGDGESGSGVGAEGGSKGRSRYVRGSWQENLFASADQTGNLRVSGLPESPLPPRAPELISCGPPTIGLGRPLPQVVLHGRAPCRIARWAASRQKLTCMLVCFQYEIQPKATPNRQIVLDGDRLLDLTGEGLFSRKWRLL